MPRYGKPATAAALVLGLVVLRGLLFHRPAHSASREGPTRVTAPPRARPSFARTFDAARFQRGNLHAHTTLSDGHSTPEQTILWYEAHGYQFLALTDHGLRSEPARYATLHDPEFVLLPGEEITMTGGGRQVHVNALCTRQKIPGGAFRTTSAALSTAISRVAAQGGVAIVNHPNFDWALSETDVLDARDAPLLEIASGHPYVHTAGDAKHPSHEALWDRALTAGAEYMGVAVDDVHRIGASGNPLALPGKGWVEVFADRPDAKALCAALARGELYSSTGIELRRLEVTPAAYRVEPVQSGVVVVFIGAKGRELARITVQGATTVASYSPTGDEGYVRARLERSDGGRAWTPAVRVVQE